MAVTTIREETKHDCSFTHTPPPMVLVLRCEQLSDDAIHDLQEIQNYLTGLGLEITIKQTEKDASITAVEYMYTFAAKREDMHIIRDYIKFLNHGHWDIREVAENEDIK